MSDLVEFLRARLDEDEAVAREAIEIRQRVYRDQFESDTTFTAWDDHPAGTVVVGPERVLREVEAKRRIVTKHSGPDMWDSADYHLCYDEMTHNDDCETLQALAAIYSDHPDYRDEWKS